MRLFSVLLGLAVVVVSLPASAQDPLVESARKEGRFMSYTSMNIPDSQPLLDAFTKKYPFIKAQVWRGASEKVLKKIQTETRAGKVLFHVVAVKAFDAGFIKANHLAQRYTPPSAKEYMKGFLDPNAYSAAIYDK